MSDQQTDDGFRKKEITNQSRSNDSFVPHSTLKSLHRCKREYFRFLSTHCNRSLGCSRRIDYRISYVCVCIFSKTFRVVVILSRKNNPVRGSDEFFDDAETALAFPPPGPENSPAFPIELYPSFLIFEISKVRCLFFYTHTHVLSFELAWLF